MDNGIGLQTARGSGNSGYVQTNKVFVRPRTGGKPGSGGKGFETDQGTAGLSKKANKDAEHDRKRQIHLKLAILEDKLMDQRYSDAEIAQKLEEARVNLEAAAATEESGGAPGDLKISDTQTRQVAARKEKQMELETIIHRSFRVRDIKMVVRSDLSERISEIFRDFMTGITKLEELGNAAHSYLLGFRQGLSLLQRPPIVTSSKLIENVIKNNETKRLKSYVEAGCINIHDAAQSTKTSESLLAALDGLANKAAIVIESATIISRQLDTESSDDEFQQVTSDEDDETATFRQELEVTEHATLIAVVYSMVKQNYVMQEKIVRSLSLKSSSDELGTYTSMWSLQPFIEDEIMNRAWKWIH